MTDKFLHPRWILEICTSYILLSDVFLGNRGLRNVDQRLLSLPLSDGSQLRDGSVSIRKTRCFSALVWSCASVLALEILGC